MNECASSTTTNMVANSLFKDDSDSLSSDDDSSFSSLSTSSSSSSEDESVRATRGRDGLPGLTRGGMITGGRPGLTRGGLVPRGDSNMSQSRRNLMALASTGRSSRNLMVFEDTAEDDPIYQRMQALLVLQKQLGIDKDTAFLAEHDKKAEEKERLMAMTPEERIAHQQEQLNKETTDFGARLRELRQKQSERKLKAKYDDKSDDDDDSDETDDTSEEDDSGGSEEEEKKGALHMRVKKEDGYVASSVRKLEMSHEKKREELRALAAGRAAGSVRAKSERNLSSNRTGCTMEHSQKPRGAMALKSTSAHSKSTRRDALVGGPSATCESVTVITPLELIKVGKVDVGTSSQSNDRQENVEFPSECMPYGSRPKATKNKLVDGNSAHQKHKERTNTLKDSKHLKQKDEKKKHSDSKHAKDTRAKVSNESQSSAKDKNAKPLDGWSRSTSKHSKNNGAEEREKSPSLAGGDSRHDKSKGSSSGLRRADSKKAIKNKSSPADAKKESSSHKINGTKMNKAAEPKDSVTQKYRRDCRHSPEKLRPLLEKSASVKEQKDKSKSKGPDSANSSTHRKKDDGEILSKDRNKSRQAPKDPGRDSTCGGDRKHEKTERKKISGDDPGKKTKKSTDSHGGRKCSNHERKSSDKGEKRSTKNTGTAHDSSHEKKTERPPKTHRKSPHDSEVDKSFEYKKSSKKTKEKVGSE